MNPETPAPNPPGPAGSSPAAVAKGRMVLTYEQFNRAVKMLQQHRQMFLDKRPTQAEAGVLLAKLCGFERPVSESTIPRLQAESGIAWASLRPKNTNPAARAKAREARHTRYGHGLRIVAVALRRLYLDLTGRSTPMLDRLLDELAGRAPASDLIDPAWAEGTPHAGA